jgi:cytochrome c-type biogenesis protein CcmH
MIFWGITGALALGAAVLLALALTRGTAQARPAAAFDIQVFRDQLAEVDRDLARGVLGDEDAARLRTEISRRILAADQQMQEGSGIAVQGRLRMAAAIAMAIFVIGGSSIAYYGSEPVFRAFERNYEIELLGEEIPVKVRLRNNPWRFSGLGAPGYGDLALKTRIENAEIARLNRPSQTEAEATLPPAPPLRGVDPNYLDLVEKLRKAVEARPGDLAGATLLARHEMALGNASAAYLAQRRVITLKGDAVTADDLAGYADTLVIAAGGYVSPEAEGALAAALEKGPSHGVARYYSGLLMAQIGRPDVAFRAWEALLRESGPEDGWTQPVRAQIEEMAFRAGVDGFELPPLDSAVMPGPDADAVAAAREMTEEDRMEMIRGMVGQLSDRLATEGGTPQEWARLLNSLGVLGEVDQATLIWQDAKDTFADTPEALAIVRRAAQQLGIVQ